MSYAPSYHRRCGSSRWTARVAATWLALCAFGSTAHAHTMPAVAPDMVQDSCILVVDRSVEPVLHVAYTVLQDDTQRDLEDIQLPDTKTHQFFALSGTLAADGLGHLFFPFDGSHDQGVIMPIWITDDDVKRAAAANSTMGATVAFAEADVPVDSTLEGHATLDGRFVRVTADDARVPITMAQAAMGFDWDLSAVPPGVYTLAGYIFSPPSNGWAGAPGVVKIRDGDVDPPAATLDAVHGLVFSYQGLPLSGCVDAPEGSTLDLDFEIIERPEDGWRPVVSAEPVTNGSFEHCFVAPADASGSARFRVRVTAPDGSALVAYSPDTATLLSGSGSCQPSDTVCCDGVPAPGAPAGAASDPPAEAGAGAGGAAPASAAGAGPGAPEPQADSGGGDAGGCAALPSAGGARTSTLALLAWFAFVALRRRRAR